MKKTIEVAAAVIRRDGRVLLSTRPEDKPPAGREFPGGKIEPGETLKQAAERELREELGVGVVALDELFRITHETEPRRDPSPVHPHGSAGGGGGDAAGGTEFRLVRSEGADASGSACAGPSGLGVPR